MREIAWAAGPLAALLRVSPQPPNFGAYRLLAISTATTINTTQRGHGPPRSTECDGPLLERGQCISREDPWVFDCGALHQVELPERSGQERRRAVSIPLCGAISTCTQVQHAEEGASYRRGMSGQRRPWDESKTDRVQEIDELVEEWTPEPLVAAPTPFEELDNEKRPVIVG